MTRSGFLAASGGAAAITILPCAAAAVQEQILLKTSSGTLAGTLAMPRSKAASVVLLISGSGPTDRDGNNPLLPGKNDALKLLAEGLATRGLASVRYDKRGIGASAFALRSESEVRFETYIDDAAGWLAILLADKRFSRVIVAGHSEGALLGTVAGQRFPIAALFTLEGAGRPAPAILRAQLKVQLSPEDYARADAILTQLQAGKTVEPPASPALASLFRESIQPYLISWFKYDPASELAKVRAPVTIVQGTSDVQTTTEDARRLAAAVPKARLLIVEGMNHVLKHAPDISSQAAILQGYSNPALPVDPQVIGAVASG